MEPYLCIDCLLTLGPAEKAGNKAGTDIKDEVVTNSKHWLETSKFCEITQTTQAKQAQIIFLNSNLMIGKGIVIRKQTDK